TSSTPALTSGDRPARARATGGASHGSSSARSSRTGGLSTAAPGGSAPPSCRRLGTGCTGGRSVAGPGTPWVPAGTAGLSSLLSTRRAIATGPVPPSGACLWVVRRLYDGGSGGSDGDRGG